MSGLSWVFLLSAFGISNVKAFDFPHTPSHTVNEKSTKVDLKIKSFQSKGSYDDLGATYKFSSTDYFRKDDFKLNFTYGIGRSLDISSGINLRLNTSKTSTYEGSTFGAESLSLSTKYQMRPLGPFLFSWNAFYKWSLFSNSPTINPTKPLTLGDSGQEVGFDLIGSFRLSETLAVVSSGGYKRPPKGLSSEIPYRLNFYGRVKAGGFKLV